MIKEKIKAKNPPEKLFEIKEESEPGSDWISDSGSSSSWDINNQNNKFET